MIRIESLLKSFSDVAAVNNVSLEIKDGEFFGLLGPNGAGKSTFINMLAGLMKPDRGMLQIRDVEYSKKAMEIKRLIGLVPQELSFYEKLTGRDNVRFFASLYGIKGRDLKKAVEMALDFTGLTESADKAANAYSGGMKRRLNIACGIAHNPEILFFDEPTAGIDPQSRNHILHSISNLNKSGKTVIYTTHYMEEAEELCTRIAILDKGKIIAKGTNQELQALIMDAGRLVIKIANIVSINRQSLETIPGVRSVVGDDQTVTITNDVGIHNINQIIDILGKSNAVVADIRADVPSLETVFLNLTGRSLRD